MPPHSLIPLFGDIALIDAATVHRSLSFESAIDALERAILGGFDPDSDSARVRISTGSGVLLVMPAALDGWSGTKLLSSTDENPRRGLPLLQGLYVLFGGEGQGTLAIIEGTSLTEIRTPAVSGLGLRHLAHSRSEPENLVVFGTGLQARAHALAVAAERSLARITIAGRFLDDAQALAADLSTTVDVPVTAVESAQPEEAVREAHIICCCTSSPTPLFNGEWVRQDATVVAMGSHFTDQREVDDALVARAQVIVESRHGVLSEAGDVMIPLASGVLQESEIHTLSEVMHNPALLRSGPRFFKTTGQPWEDLVVAATIYATVRGSSDISAED